MPSSASKAAPNSKDAPAAGNIPHAANGSDAPEITSRGQRERVGRDAGARDIAAHAAQRPVERLDRKTTEQHRARFTLNARIERAARDRYTLPPYAASTSAGSARKSPISAFS